jgi:hypothetical protein
MTIPTTAAIGKVLEAAESRQIQREVGGCEDRAPKYGSHPPLDDHSQEGRSRGPEAS